MLFYKTINSKTLELLKNLRLVDGTSLALQIGHRIAIDIDLYFLLQQFILKEILSFYNHKYHDGSIFFSFKKFAYFNDADDDIMPKMLNKINWDQIKNNIQEKLQNYLIQNK